MKHHWKLATLALACVVSVQAQAPQPSPEKKIALDVLPRVNVTVLVDNMAGRGPRAWANGVSPS